MLCIKNGLVNDAVNREAYMADILVSGSESELPGKIIAIGSNLEFPEGTAAYSGQTFFAQPPKLFDQLFPRVLAAEQQRILADRKDG